MNQAAGFAAPALGSLRVGKPHHKRKHASAAPATLEEDNPIHIAFNPNILLRPNDVFRHAATQQVRMSIFLHTIKPDKGHATHLHFQRKLISNHRNPASYHLGHRT